MDGALQFTETSCTFVLGLGWVPVIFASSPRNVARGGVTRFAFTIWGRGQLGMVERLQHRLASTRMSIWCVTHTHTRRLGGYVPRELSEWLVRPQRLDRGFWVNTRRDIRFNCWFATACWVMYQWGTGVYVFARAHSFWRRSSRCRRIAMAFCPRFYLQGKDDKRWRGITETASMFLNWEWFFNSQFVPAYTAACHISTFNNMYVLSLAQIFDAEKTHPWRSRWDFVRCLSYKKKMIKRWWKPIGKTCSFVSIPFVSHRRSAKLYILPRVQLLTHIEPMHEDRDGILFLNLPIRRGRKMTGNYRKGPRI